MLGRYSHPELAWELSIAALWIAALLVLNRLAFARGVRRYGAFGG
jgi:ABC-2 type transport system permease protein